MTLVKGRDNGHFSATELFNMLNNYGHHLQGGPHYKSSLFPACQLFTVVNLRFQLIVNTKWPHYKGSGTKVPSLAGNYEALSYANP